MLIRYIYFNPACTILDAFDDDGNGFVINPGSRHSYSCMAILLEVGVHKNLNYSKTQTGYSLPHWLAYWAVGEECASFGLRYRLT